jgi:molybdopterin/thiamine biosynthesis adenylyltransferase
MKEQSDIFSRSILVWGEEKQRMLSDACIMIAGVGGLGCFVAELLVRNGIKKIVLVDHGNVDRPDLNRQILFTSHDLGKSKVETAVIKLSAIHGLSEIVPVNLDIRQTRDLQCLVEQNQIHGIADCLDNYRSRFALETVLTPALFLVHGGVQGDYGQVTTIRKEGSVKLAKLYANAETMQTPLPVCVQAVASIGAMMVQEILNNLWGQPQLLNQLLIVELTDFTFSRIQLS